MSRFMKFSVKCDAEWEREDGTTDYLSLTKEIRALGLRSALDKGMRWLEVQVDAHPIASMRKRGSLYFRMEATARVEEIER